MHKKIIVCAGLEKCGTTSFADYFRSCKEVSVPEIKELDYFGANFTKGPQWFFAHHDSGRAVWLDASPTYHWNQECYERIIGTCKNYIVLLMFRDPIVRAYSAYLHRIRWFLPDNYKSFESLREFDETFVEVYERQLEFCFPSYVKEIERAKTIIPYERLVLTSMEDFLRKPEKVVTRIENILNFESHMPTCVIVPQSNQAELPGISTGAEIRERDPSRTDIDDEHVYIHSGSRMRCIGRITDLPRIREIQRKWASPISSMTVKRMYDETYSREALILENEFGICTEAWGETKPLGTAE